MWVLLKLTWNENTILKRGSLRNFPMSVNNNVQRFFFLLWAASVVTCFLSKEIYQAISPIRATHILSAKKRSNCMCVWLLISPSLLITNHYHSKPKCEQWRVSATGLPGLRNRLKTECPTPNTPEVRQTMPPIPRDTHWARYSRESCGLVYSFSFFVFFSLGCRGRSSVRIKGWARLWPDRNEDVLPKKKERKHGGLCSEKGPWMDTEKWRTAVGKASRPWTSASRLEDDCLCPH